MWKFLGHFLNEVRMDWGLSSDNFYSKHELLEFFGKFGPVD
jgi:hypothetical protein